MCVEVGGVLSPMEEAGELLARCPTAGLGVTVCAAAAGLLLYRIARR